MMKPEAFMSDQITVQNLGKIAEGFKREGALPEARRIWARAAEFIVSQEFQDNRDTIALLVVESMARGLEIETALSLANEIKGDGARNGALACIASALAAAGNDDGAMVTMQRIPPSPLRTITLESVAEAQAAGGRTDAAFQNLEALVRCEDPDLEKVATAFAGRGDFESAKRVAGMAPDTEDRIRSLVKIGEIEGKKDRNAAGATIDAAWALAREYRTRENSDRASEVLAEVAKTALQAGHKQAIEYLRMAAEADLGITKRHAWPTPAQGVIELLIQRREVGIAEQLISKLQPVADRASLHVMIAKCWLDQKDEPRALSALRRSVEEIDSEADDGNSMAGQRKDSLLAEVAGIFLRAGEGAESDRIMARYRADDWRRMDVIRSVSSELAALGKLDQARQLLEGIPVSDFRHYQAIEDLADIVLRMSGESAALAWARSLKRDSDRATALVRIVQGEIDPGP